LGVVAGMANAFRKISPEAWLLISVLAIVAIAAVIVLVASWNPTLKTEAGKTALSVLAVSVFGALVTIAAGRYQQRRKEAAENRLHQEGLRRQEIEILQDARSREDALLRTLLQDTLRNYNRVKATRRLLKAYTKTDDGRSITAAVYDKHLEQLIDEQLKFEEFKRVAYAGGSKRLGLPSLFCNYEKIEKYLNKVISEYERNRHRVESSVEVSLAQLQRLSSFFEGKRVDNGVDTGFEENVSSQIDQIVQQIQRTLLEPLVPPPMPPLVTDVANAQLPSTD
jgi:hypothetical protein